MLYTIYKTTNTKNGKIYIGMHTTVDPFDDYIGSGHGLKIAISKHGRDAFVKEVLHVFDTEAEMVEKEMELVNEEFVARRDTYNRTLGGVGSFFHINSQRTQGAFAGKVHTEESKAKMRLSQQRAQNLPHNRLRNSINQQKAQNRPEVKAAKSARTFAYMANPDIRQKHKDACNTPEFKAAQSTARVGNVWINNGVLQQYVPPAELDRWIKSGWLLGMISQTHNLNKRYINNGITNKLIPGDVVDEFLATGWSLGMKQKNRML